MEPESKKLKPVSKPTSAFVGTKYVGTDKLGRPLTAAESRQLAALLREHNFDGASMVSLRFAFRLTRNKAAAEDVQGRIYDRLLRGGWDPSEVSLPKRLCRLVWSEQTHEVREDKQRRNAETGFLREHGLDHSDSGAPSVAEFAVRLESERAEETHGKARVAALRAAFTEANDHLNLLWLEYYLSGVEEPGEMARLSNHEPEEFYRAADRRKRHVNRLLAAERGATLQEDE